uniref:Uncharacterized protein n=1 Tax=Neobodo designis TaxID=312471 RepID=A0A7S1Q6C1_NEODS|mmetsp:Transcript_31890/g.98683  ORF Transcript_31890/g.98683 Transcript_31890/m.98683 type:complete len:297 (+) Transcript_31890:119-1009(+)|eukprot:CAMPEP_0174827966 /NCGR_PEP_ID=MMETSP1114-20130205/1048_1 /TAXON_ID=312471 /ORGANISM="Neobodo designis, Strain CCAP 1951/1" /LENGTH=296 /DNA_ID=CAMNT_0016061657 /DNA_START=121 /DNA_END=1011 /DNA_ORIENTATION=+
MPTKLPPIKQQRSDQEQPASKAAPSPKPEGEVVVARRRDRNPLALSKGRSPTRADSPAQAGEEARLTKAQRKRKLEAEKEHALFVQRENGFRYNAFQTPGVFSTFTADTLVLADRDRKLVEVAVARRRAQIEHDRKQRELARADELRRRKMEQERVQKQHDLRRAQEESELRKQQEEAAKARRNRAAAHTLAERRRKEIDEARQLSERREAHRETRRAGKDPHLEAEQEKKRGNSPSPSPRQNPSSPETRSPRDSHDTAAAVSILLGSYGNDDSPTAEGGDSSHPALSIVLDALGA